MDNTSRDKTWLWSGAGACTGLLVRRWSLHWTLGQDTGVNLGAEVSRSRRAWRRSGRRAWLQNGQRAWESHIRKNLTSEQPAGLREPQPVDLSERQPAKLTLERPADLTDEQPANLTDERPADSQHSRWSRRTPMPNYSRLGRDDERRLPCRGKNKQEPTKKTFKKRKIKQWKKVPLTLWLGLVFCHGAHTAGRNKDHGDEDKLKSTVFNPTQQGKTRQGWDTQEHRERNK